MSDEQIPVDVVVEDQFPELSNYRDPFAVEAKPKHVPLAAIGEAFEKNDLKERSSALVRTDAPDESRFRDLERLKSSVRGQWPDGRYNDILADERPMAQTVGDEGKVIRILPVTPKLAGENGLVSGSGVARFVAASLGVGKPGIIPLWHSGFTVLIGVSKPDEIFDVQIRLQSEVHSIGISTAGQLYTTDDVHTVTVQVDAAIQRITDCSVQDWTPEWIADNLDVRDIPFLLAGFLSTMYPEGYPFLRECRNFGKGCTYSTVSTSAETPLPHLDFTKIGWVDLARFSKTARRHMAAGFGQHTVESVISYRDALNGTDAYIGPCNDTGSVLYHIAPAAPMYSMYRSEGRLWVHQIEDTVNRAMDIQDYVDEATTRQSRLAFLNQNIHDLQAQRHMSWVKSIRMTPVGGGDPMFISDRETIKDTLGQLSKAENITETLIKQVEAWKIKNLNTFTGIPNYSCPSCKASQLPDDAPRQTLIPINVSEYFFGIMELRRFRLV